MMRLIQAAAAILLAFATSLAYGQACTQTINPGNTLTATVVAAPNGAVICLNAGTYLPNNANFPTIDRFAIGRAVTVRGAPGTTPAQVVLQSSPIADYALIFTNYIGGGANASGATVQGLTIQGAPGGVQVYNYTNTPGGRLTDITLRDVVITTVASGAFGVLLRDADRINLDNVTVTSSGTALWLQDVTASLIMNSTVTGTANEAAAALAVFGGSRNTIVGNTFGQTPTPGVYSFKGGGVVFNNTVGNRFEDNLLQGFRDDGVDFTSLDLTGTVPQATQNSTDNYAGKNRIVSTRSADGFTLGGAGLWSNCGSHRTWFYANDSQGVPECGICVYDGNSNMLLGNNLHNNGITGILFSGGTETHPFCTVAGGAYRGKPTNSYVQSNAAYYNKNDQIFIRSSDSTQLSRNYASRRNGVGGALRPECQTAVCQSAFTLDGTAGLPSVGASFAANINHENIRGFWDDSGVNTGVQFYLNKMIQPDPLSINRYVIATSTLWDGGAVGGNYWTVFGGANANPGSVPYGTPGTGNVAQGVFHNLANQTGNIVDRFPFRDEHMGRGWNVTVYEPRSGAVLSRDTRRTVRWSAPGCTYVDIALDGSTSLGGNLPNTGYAIVTVPTGATIGTHNIVVTCKDSGAAARGSGTSANFTVSDSTLQLKAPGRDDVFNAGSQVLVAWKKSAAIATVNIDLSTDGGVTFPTSLGAGFTGTVARVTIPGAAASAYAVIRVSGGGTSDQNDGVFAIRGTGQGFANVPSGRKFVMGSLERLEWRSPLNSALVDITATVLGQPYVIATNLPDRGYYDWLMSSTGIGTLNLQINFKTSAGTAINSATNNLGTTAYPTTIAFSPVGTLGIGATTNVSATTNSGLAVTITSLTPSICTIAGSVVTGQSAGTCTLAGNQAGNASFAAASQVTTSFTVASNANPPRLLNISTRMQVLTGNDVMIGGFVIGGGASKTVAIVATGPSLAAFGITNALQDPTLRLVRSSDQATLATNDNWQQAGNAAQLQAAGFAPTNPFESAILTTLPPGAYTAIVEGGAGQTGVGVVAVYEVDLPNIPLINISTRGRVLTGNDVMIGGFVVTGTGNQTVAIVGTGPSLAPFGIANPLANPQLQLVRSSDQATLATNDNWQNAANAANIQASGFAPTDPLESAILISLPPGAYTVILSGVGGGTGVGVVGVYTTTAPP